MSSLGVIFFAAFAAIAVLSAFGTISSRTPIRSAMCLLAHILSLAALYVSLYAQLLAAMQLIVYAGAVVVLFVFVIMLIGPTEEPRSLSIDGLTPRMLGLVLMAAVGVTVASGVGHIKTEAPAIEGCPPGVVECAQFGGVEGIAKVLYIDAAVPFELVSILLLVAIIGAIAVARGRSLAEARRLKATRLKEDADDLRNLAPEASASSGG
jgi:NADH-quinone oxidoreductase subunit J